MAEKLSKSILGGLKKMLHREPEKPTGSTPRKPSGSKEAKEGARKQASSPSSVSSSPDQAAAAEAPEAKQDKNKPKNQPWYRHRQRW